MRIQRRSDSYTLDDTLCSTRTTANYTGTANNDGYSQASSLYSRIESHSFRNFYSISCRLW